MNVLTTRWMLNGCLLGILLSVLLSVLAEAAPNDGIGALEQQVLGARYENQSIEMRVSRLENALRASAPPASSMPYRVSRLFAMQQAKIGQQNHQAAVQAYNRAIDQTNQGKTDEAITSYRKAIQADPGLVEAYNNLANILLQQNQYDETVALYKQGLEHRPNDPVLHRNLGVLYEKLGKVPEAVAEYKIYLQLTDKPDPPIAQIVKTYQTYRKAGQGAPDYAVAATEATKGQALLWPEKNNPIRIYVNVDHADQQFVPVLVQQAMDAWQDASKGRLRFQLTDQSAQANIMIRLKDGPLMDPNKDIGHTEYTMPERQLFEHHMDHVSITLNTGNEENLKTLPDDSRKAQIYRMTLHELGHAIGIWGHSPDPGDIMFTHPIASGLSTRDVNTVRKLYGL